MCVSCLCVGVIQQIVTHNNNKHTTDTTHTTHKTDTTDTTHTTHTIYSQYHWYIPSNNSLVPLNVFVISGKVLLLLGIIYFSVRFCSVDMSLDSTTFQFGKHVIKDKLIQFPVPKGTNDVLVQKLENALKTWSSHVLEGHGYRVEVVVTDERVWTVGALKQIAKKINKLNDPDPQVRHEEIASVFVDREFAINNLVCLCVCTSNFLETPETLRSWARLQTQKISNFLPKIIA